MAKLVRVFLTGATRKNEDAIAALSYEGKKVFTWNAASSDWEAQIPEFNIEQITDWLRGYCPDVVVVVDQEITVPSQVVQECNPLPPLKTYLSELKYSTASTAKTERPHMVDIYLEGQHSMGDEEFIRNLLFNDKQGFIWEDKRWRAKITEHTYCNILAAFKAGCPNIEVCLKCELNNE